MNLSLFLNFYWLISGCCAIHYVKEADLVLGGDEGKECTYSKGYMKRQAIFSCLTCAPEGNAGVCTACSLTCHDGHEVFSLDILYSIEDLVVDGLWLNIETKCCWPGNSQGLR